jgi:serine/threonine protein kinase
MTLAIAAFVDALRECHLLEPAQLDKLNRALQGRAAEPRAVARELLKQGWLTAYQADLLLQGRGRELVLGEYLLLEPLGEGGMGQVFKARHRLMNRIVALKVIRKERLAEASAVERFHREIRLAAQLDHPHVVRAHDAAQVGDTHFLVMEYAEGADLQRLVQQAGPLPVAQACAYLSQAAEGLHHASKHGLVHRDIKPSNLQVTAQGKVVKILDMGLARLQAGEADGGPGTELTQQRMVLGTPDYMAPEQIDDARRVDVRADIYSLGCTFYFMLAGRPPFAGISWEEKLACHRKLEPQPIEQLRPDLPPGLGAILRKMMAKRPEERYAAAAGVAEALKPFCQTSGLAALASATWSGARPQPTTASAPPAPAPAPAAVASSVDRPAAVPGPGWTLLADSTAYPTTVPPTQPGSAVLPAGPAVLSAGQQPGAPASAPAHPGPGRRFWLLLAAGNALLGLVILAVLLWSKFSETGKKGDDRQAKAGGSTTQVSDTNKDPAKARVPVKPLLDEDFRAAYENKEVLPRGWTGEGYRVGMEGGETYLELSGADPGGFGFPGGPGFGPPPKGGLQPTGGLLGVKTPPVTLGGNFVISGRYFLFNSTVAVNFSQTLSLRLEGRKNSALEHVTFFQDGRVSLSDDLLNPQSLLKRSLHHFAIIREGRKLTVKIDNTPVGEKTLQEVAEYDTVRVGLTRSGRILGQAAPPPRLLRITIEDPPKGKL